MRARARVRFCQPCLCCHALPRITQVSCRATTSHGSLETIRIGGINFDTYFHSDTESKCEEKHAGRKIYIPIGSNFSRVCGTLALCTVATKSLATHVHTRSTLSRSPRRSQPVGRRPSHRFRETEPAAAAAAAAERDYGVSSAAADDGDGRANSQPRRSYGIYSSWDSGEE